MLIRIAAFACLGGYLYGYDLGLISGAFAPIQADLGASDFTMEIMVSGAKFGAVIGTFLGGALMLHYGRRPAIGFDSLFFVLGPLLMAFSSSMIGLIVGRVLVGIGIGVSAVVVPAYLGEVAPARLRGRIVESYEVLLCIGMLMAILVDSALHNVTYNWRWMVGAPIIPALFLAAALLILPESPRWLVTRHRLDEALAVMHQVYTKSRLPMGSQQSTAEVEQELLELWSSVEKEKDAIREINLQAHQRSLAYRASKGWRGLRFGTQRRWHTLSETPGPSHEEGTDLRRSIEMFSSRTDSPTSPRPAVPGEDMPGPQVPDDRSPIQEAESQSLMRTAPLHAVSSSHGQPSTSIDASAFAGEEVQGLASESEPSPPAGASTGGGDSPTPNPIHKALSNPTSPLYRSLSEIPKNLPPVRTKSEEGLDFDDTQSPPQAPRKLASIKRQPSGSHTSHRSFWLCLWDMLKQIKTIAHGEEREAFFITLVLAFVNQGMASSSIIYYAPQMIAEAGVHNQRTADLLTSTITAAKMAGVFAGVALIDTLGRRPLLIWGSFCCSASLVLLFGAVFVKNAAFEILGMCAFMLAFNASYAGTFWVILSELFSMTAKSPAASAATAMMFLAGSVADGLFLTVLRLLGSYSFFVYASIAFFGGCFSYWKVPETKGFTLSEIQDMLGGKVKQLPETTTQTSEEDKKSPTQEPQDRQHLLPGNDDLKRDPEDQRTTP